METIITALCCVMPSGECLWFDKETHSEEYVNKVIDKWKQENSEYVAGGCSMGFVQLEMPEKDYKSIPACASFQFPEAD